VFRADSAGGGVAGSRGGKVLLVELSDGGDAQHVVKRYASTKRETDEGWEHTSVTLQSDNPGHDSIELAPEQQVRVIGEFLGLANARAS